MRLQATLTALLLPRLLAGGAPLPLDGLIRPSADGSAYAYLPPPRGGNHAASLARLPDGALVAAWFTGGEGTPNCSIAVSRLAAGGDRWTPGAVAVTVFFCCRAGRGKVVTLEEQAEAAATTM